MLADNEKIYDEQIYPLMAQIIAICQTNNIPFAATFEYAPGDFCSSMIQHKDMDPWIGGIAAQVEERIRQDRRRATAGMFQITVEHADGSKTIEVAIP